MHLGVDAVGIKHSGGATVLLDFLAAAVSDDRLSKITVFCSPRGARNFDLPQSDKIMEIQLPIVERSYLYQALWFEVLLGRYCKRIATDVLFCAGGVGSAQPPIPHVTFIQQSLPFSREALARLGTFLRCRVTVLRLMMKRSSRSSRRVFVQTPTMRECVSRDFDIEKEHIEVFIPSPRSLPDHNDMNPLLDRMRATPADARLLYVGNEVPYKNLEMATIAMREARKSVPEARLFLTSSPKHSLCRVEGVTGVGYLGASGLRQAYELATLLIMPSLVETCALPISEAMSVGTPVLAADRPYAHDMCEDAAEFFDPLSAPDFTNKVISLLADERRREELAACGLALVKKRRASMPYEHMVEEIVQVVDDVD